MISSHKQPSAWPKILLLGITIGTALLSCVTPLKQAELDSEQLVFSIRWTFFAKKEKSSFSSRLFIKGDEALRLDLFQSLTGTLARMILKNNMFILQTPFQKTYYEGEIQKGGLLPGLPLMPSADFSALFRGRNPKGWVCQTTNTRPVLCKKNSFVIRWKWKKSLLKTIHFEKQDEGLSLVAEIRDISSKPFHPRIFYPHLKGWKKSPDPLFFTHF